MMDLKKDLMVTEVEVSDDSTLVSECGSENGVSILITGATGFLGKVVVEGLLRNEHKYNLSKIFILTRSKNGYASEERFKKKISSSPCFSKLSEECMDCVHMVTGDLSMPNCGLDEKNYQTVTEELTHIIHCAASISFELPVAEAAEANITTTLNVLELARHSPNLQRLVSTSTAYVTPHHDGPIHEVLAPLPRPASELYKDIQAGRVKEADLLRATGHSNTYTLTKCIAEHLLMEQKKTIPITIVRPSIISAARRFPFPGWVDSQAAFTAVVATFGGGLLKVCEVNPTTYLDVVPVDDVAHRLIEEALTIKREATEAPIIYSVASLKYTENIGALFPLIRDYYNSLPHRKVSAVVGPRNLNFHAQKFIHHTLKLKLALAYSTMTRNQKLSMALRKQMDVLAVIDSCFPYFTSHSFDFRPSVEMSDDFVWGDYMRLVCAGVEEHLLKRLR